MRRRNFLATVSAGTATAVAGCSAIPGSDDQKLYEQGSKEQLLPAEAEEDWPDPELNRAYEEDVGRVFTDDEQTILVAMVLKILETVEDAEDDMQRREATVGDVSEYPLADEAFIYDDSESATFVLRDLNAVGFVIATRRSGLEDKPARLKARRYAELMYNDYWVPAANGQE